MAKMMLQWLMGALFFAASISRGSCATHCWDFNGNFDSSGMVNGPVTKIGPFDWKASEDEYPEISTVPSFYEIDGGFAWFQDQDTPPTAGSMASANTITLTTGDRITVSIWRNILDGKDNDTSRPIVRFYSSGGAVVSNILYSVKYDMWDYPFIECGSVSDIENNKAQCCGSTNPTSCTGYFQIDGTALVRDELLVIDNLDVNGGCGGITPPPTPPTTESTATAVTGTTETPPPTPPQPECCHFEDDGLCGWSAVTDNGCWHWSGDIQPYDPTVVPPFDGNYIWVMDASALVESDVLHDVTSATTFSFDYYLTTTSGISQEVYFAKSETEYVRLGELSTTNNWESFTTTCGTCCGSGVSSCDGQIVIQSKTAPGERVFLAIDEFSVDDACGDVPPNWCCDFEADPLCEWSVFYSTIGWHSSLNLLPRAPVPPNTLGYLWAEDETSSMTSSNLFGITSTSNFYLEYYFSPADPKGNTLKFLFKPSAPAAPAVVLGSATHYGSWTPLTLACTTACCQSGLTCAGYFVVETTNAVTNTEVAAIDNFSVNSACSGPAPPAPAQYCCNFDEGSLCDWSPHYITNGWEWSKTYHSIFTIPPSPNGNDYIFVDNDSADAYSPELADITVGTTFEVSYYFYTATPDASNFVDIAFVNEFGFTAVLSSNVPESPSNAWGSYLVSCGATGTSADCCNGGAAPCSGHYYFRTHNAPGVDLVAAIDDFSVNGDIC